MPRLTYTPAGSDTPKVWDFSFGKMLSPECIAIEKQTGLRWAAVSDALFESDMAVIHAFLWIFLKREIPTLRASEVVFCADEVDLDLTDDEARDIRDDLRTKKAQLSDEELEALQMFEERCADLDEGGAEGDGPKGD